MVALVLEAMSIGFVAGVTPGPLQIFLLLQTLRHGARRSIWLVLSPLISDGPIVPFILIVLGQASDNLLSGIGLIGGLFILRIARGVWQQLRTGETFHLDAESLAHAQTSTQRQAFRQAVLINALGPGVWLFWGAVLGPLIIAAWRDDPPNAAVFVVTFYVTFLSTMAAQVALFHQSRRLGPTFVRGVLWLGLAIMVGFGGLLIWRALDALLG